MPSPEVPSADSARVPPAPAAPQAAASPVPAPGDGGMEDRLASSGERSEWFRSLPPEMQEEYRAHWARTAARAGERTAFRKRSYGWGAARGALVLVIVHAMFGFGGWLGLVAAAAAGASLGLLWAQFDAGVMKSAISAGIVSVGVWFAFMPEVGVALIFVLFDALVGMSLGAVAGQMRELRRGDDLE